MTDDHSSLNLQPPEEGAWGAFDELERRVLALVGQLREARTQQAQADLDLERLRDQLRERDTQIVVLQEELRGDTMRDTIKRRGEALLVLVAELEREG